MCEESVAENLILCFLTIRYTNLGFRLLVVPGYFQLYHSLCNFLCYLWKAKFL